MESCHAPSVSYEYQPLLVGQEAFLVFDLGLHILCGDTGLRRHQGDGLTDEGLDEYLHLVSDSRYLLNLKEKQLM